MLDSTMGLSTMFIFFQRKIHSVYGLFLLLGYSLLRIEQKSIVYVV